MERRDMGAAAAAKYETESAAEYELDDTTAEDGEKFAIRITGLRKNYGSREVLKGVDLQIQKGEIFALLGVNGAGKTTALECMEDLRCYDSGAIRVEGTRGIQLQSSALPEHIRPMEAVRLFAKWKNVRPQEELLAALGIPAMGKKTYRQMSTGQKRRLHLALAMLGDPEILFLDEPTAGLDVEGKIALHGLIRRWKDVGKTIVLASHDMAEVEELCDRIAVLHEGKIIFCGSPGELTDQMEKQFTVQIRTQNRTEEYQTGDVAQTLLERLGELKRQGVEVLDITVDRGSLEQHFMELTGRVEE